MGEHLMAIGILLSFVAGSLIVTYVTGRLAESLFDTITRSREPAFAGFIAALCLAVARDNPFGAEESTFSKIVYPLLLPSGACLGLILLWLKRVRPERLRHAAADQA